MASKITTNATGGDARPSSPASLPGAAGTVSNVTIAPDQGPPASTAIVFDAERPHASNVTALTDDEARAFVASLEAAKPTAANVVWVGGEDAQGVPLVAPTLISLGGFPDTHLGEAERGGKPFFSPAGAVIVDATPGFKVFRPNKGVK